MPDPVPEARSRLRVLTWNVHACVGTDGRHDVARVSAEVCALAPDIAAFQEVDSRRLSSDAMEVHNSLRAAVGDHGHDAWSITGTDGRYGQILASRFPLEDKEVHDISVAGREPRKAMTARTRLPTATLRIIATHLGLRRRERRYQLEALREIVCADLSSPLLLLGDFNEWCLPGRAHRRLAALRGALSRGELSRAVASLRFGSDLVPPGSPAGPLLGFPPRAAGLGPPAGRGRTGSARAPGTTVRRPVPAPSS